MIGEERDRPVVLETVDSEKIGADVIERVGGGEGALHPWILFKQSHYLYFYQKPYNFI
jgi:hypothetical protein